MTNAQGVLACLIARKSNYEELIRMGLTGLMFLPEDQLVFNEIVKYRTENDVDEVIIHNLKLAQPDKLALLDWHVEVNWYEHTQYFKGLEGEYIEREKARIINDQPNTRQGCLESAVALTSLAQSGEVVEESLQAIVEDTIKVVQERQAEDYRSKFAFNKGLQLLNRLGHYEPGSLVTLGGGSGHGKSTFALNLTLKWLANDLKVIYFSNEFSPVILLAKLICIKEGLHWQQLMNSRGERLTPEGYTLAIAALDSFRDENLQIYTRRYTLPEMSLIIKTYKPDVFILDTINALIGDHNQDRIDISLGNMARQMKGLAEEIDGLGIVVAQLRDTHGRPTDKNLVKESRQIRDASDYMDFVYREFEQRPYSKHEKLKNVFELYRVKGRYTGGGHAFLRFNKDNGRITDYDPPDLKDIVEYITKHKGNLYREEL